MKQSFARILFPAAVAASLLVGCGSDDNSSNVERGDDSSSSVESSSSSEPESSSSEDVPELPKGVRAATLEDLDKNISLGKMFGVDVFLAAGAKQGVFSIWIPDSAWIAVRSEFKNGVIEYGKTVGSFMGTGVATSDSLKAFFEKGGQFQFVVKDDKLQYSLNGGDYVVTEKAKVKISDNKISEASMLQGQKLSCKNGDTTHVYSFYKGRFLDETKIGSDASWSAGYYDVQRSYLLMLPVFFDQPVFSLTTGTVSSAYNLTMATGAEYACEKSELKYSEIAHDSLAGEWVASDDGLDWTLELKSSGEYSVNAKKGANSEDVRSGSWDVYGNVLFLKNTSCKKPSECASSVKGVLEGFDAQTGFTYKHSDKTSPKLPETWTVQKYE